MFIQIKLAMRIDAPACIYCRLDSIDMRPEGFSVSFFGVFSHTPMNFSISVNLEKPINVSNSTWSEQGMGIFTLTLAKL